MAPDPRHTLGIDGEDAACRELVRRGYAILARRYRARRGEIDIVARHEGTLVFVEVKTRSGPAFGTGASAVTWHKRRRLVSAALEFMSRHGAVDVPCRFDVVDVTPGPGGRIEVYVNAFSND